jgi:hypothetical protein
VKESVLVVVSELVAIDFDLAEKQNTYAAMAKTNTCRNLHDGNGSKVDRCLPVEITGGHGFLLFAL